jgi:PIN domain nuclease of toxin-antitoxin system
MSRLIRTDKNNSTSETVEPSTASPMAKDTVVAHLKKCQSIAGQYAQQAFPKYLEELHEALNKAMDTASSNNEVTELTGLQRQFARNRAELERYYCGYIAEGFVKFKKKELHTELHGGGSADNEQLSLVDNDALDETITLLSIVQKVDVLYAEPIWALNQRFAVLNDGEQVVDASNPAAPIQLCESLRRALRLIPLTAKAKNIAYRVFEQRLTELARNVIEDINLYLKSAGILPNLRYTPPKPPKSEQHHSAPQPERQPHERLRGGNSGAAYVPLPDPNQSSEKYQSALLQAIRGLQINMMGGRRAADNTGRAGLDTSTGSANPFINYIPIPGAVGAPSAVITSDQLMAALQVIQANALNAGAMANQAGPASMIPLDFGQVLASLGQQFQQNPANKDSKVSNTDMHTIDLVGMVFEFMLKDENLPDSVKALLSYMHTPFLKLAFIDPGFFEQPEHPARMLLNSLAEAGVRWVGNDGTVQHDIYEKIKSVVDSVLRDFKNDVRVITSLLLEFNSYTNGIIRRQELMEKRAAEKAQGEERLREVKISVNEQIRQRTDGKDWPASVLLFLLQPWADYMSFALLRYGDSSERWKRAVALVDDLLWVIEPKTSEEDLQRQQDLAHSLVPEINAGFETIGYDQAKGSKLADSIASLIELAQQKKIAEPAPAVVRDELEKIAAEKAGQLLEQAANISENEAAVMDNLKLIEFGTWFEFEDGKRLKIAWYNARTSHYMLVDQMGKKVAMMSGLDIAREMIAKRAKIIAGSSKPFFERALENIFQKLNAQAETQSGEIKNDEQ